MTFASSISLFIAMFILAVIPGPGILIVVARSINAGFRHGISTSLGIVAGDFVYITLAIFGLTTLSASLGYFFIYVKYFGAAYLIFLGLSLLFARSKKSKSYVTKPLNHYASFSAGLFTTISNPKAILFYVSFLPIFLDLSHVTIADAAILYINALITVGGVMIGYAYGAHKTHTSLNTSRGASYFRYISAVMLIGGGVYIAVRS